LESNPSAGSWEGNDACDSTNPEKRAGNKPRPGKTRKKKRNTAGGRKIDRARRGRYEGSVVFNVRPSSPELGAGKKKKQAGGNVRLAVQGG